MLPKAPVELIRPVPLESSVRRSLTIPLGEAMTLTLQHRVEIVPEPRSVSTSVIALELPDVGCLTAIHLERTAWRPV